MSRTFALIEGLTRAFYGEEPALPPDEDGLWCGIALTLDLFAAHPEWMMALVRLRFRPDEHVFLREAEMARAAAFITAHPLTEVAEVTP